LQWKLQSSLAESTRVHPRVHSSWEACIGHLVEADDAAAAAGDDAATATPAWLSFWNVVVEGAVLASASHVKKYLGLRVFLILFQKLTTTTATAAAVSDARAATVSKLFTRNFLRVWQNHLASRDTHLHPCAVHVQKLVCDTVAAQAAAGQSTLAFHVVAGKFSCK
jgi:hypothetical protein